MPYDQKMQIYLNKYAECMEEIKLRTESIRSLCRGTTPPMEKKIAAECICLQIRKILELIALASLVANKEVYAEKHVNFRKAWRAKEILANIEKFNIGFYPQPSAQILDKGTQRPIKLVRIEKGYLTRSDFEAIYDRCSDIIHAENPFKNRKNIDDFIEIIPKWIEKIIKLLNHHTIQLPNNKFQFWVIMQGKTDGKVHVTLFEKIKNEERLNTQNPSPKENL